MCTVKNFQLMGVVNITPNSFSDGGKYFDSSSAISKAFSLCDEGADIIDLGAESTGPNSLPVLFEEEKRRLELVFLHPRFLDLKNKIKISVDTYKSQIAQMALAYGASVINDVSGLRADPEMAGVIASSKAEVVIMFSKEQGLPHVTKRLKNYVSIIDEICEFFDERLEYAAKEGIKETKIILDPGMGAFLGPDPKYSWEVIRSLKIFRERFRNFRFLYGVSRKSFIKNQVSEGLVDVGSKLVEYELFKNGVDIIRTHNVKMFTELLPIMSEMKF